MLTRNLALLSLALTVVPFAHSSQADPTQAEPAQAEPPMDLSQFEHDRRFDFLLGEWDYAFDSGCGHARYWKGPEGNSVLEFLSPGYFGPRAFTGFSVLVTDAATGVWKHNWVDSMGNTLLATGDLVTAHPDYEQPVMQTEFSFQDRPFRHVWYGVDTKNFYTDLWVGGGEDSDTFQKLRTIHFWRADTQRDFEDNCETINTPA